MHGAPRNMQQRHKRVSDLEERAPALINLPIPDPTLPPLLQPLVDPLAPLITPLIDGQHPASSTSKAPAGHATSTNTPQAPTPNPTTAAPSPSSPSNTPSGGSDPANGSGGGQGNPGNGGGGQGAAGSGGSSGSGGGNPGSPGGGGGSGSSPDSSGNGATNPPAPAPNEPSPAGAAPGATGAAVSSPAPSSLNPPGVPASGGQQTSGASSVSAGSVAETSFPAVINANGAAFLSGSTSVLFPGQPGYSGYTTANSANAATATGVDVTTGGMTGSPSTQSGGGSSSSTSNADPSRPSQSSDDGVHHGLSAGIIIAISVIVALLFLVLLVFCCRRRAIALRLRRRKNWFVAGSYGSGVSPDDYKDGSGGAGKSARSSFATNFDRGQMLTPAPQLDLLPPIDQMSQVWPSNMSGSITVPPVSRTVESEPSPTIRAAPDRTSLSSLSSGGGGTSRPPSQTSQYLTLPGAAATEASPYGLDFPSPFSVRPFSPSETFSFPRPPQGDAHGRGSGVLDNSVLSGSALSASESSAAFFTAEDHLGSSASTSPDPHCENPFLDFTEIAAGAARPPSTSTESCPSSHFAPVETIRRPFVPTMEDEMAVVQGERVRILRRFDDGWAYAEKVSTGSQGLIPIDCLRPVAEDLPAFLAKKRLSSYVPGPTDARDRRATLMSQRTSVVSGTSVGKAM
ncbi:hypothetical protein BD414DRAFT_275258 [Trametes punicea]|nr:hypothetical protein BD414DRAFT_275258 [Trametes punicea]